MCGYILANKNKQKNERKNMTKANSRSKIKNEEAGRKKATLSEPRRKRW